MAVNLFAEARPPGIYKQDYINELFSRYSDPSIPVPVAPPLPNWDTEDLPSNTRLNSNKFASLSDDDDNEDNSNDTQETTMPKNPKRQKTMNNKRARVQETKVNPQFADPDLPGIEVCTDPDEIARVRQETQQICDWNGLGFPGAQPVSMDQRNIRYLYEKKYRVSWKADGTR